MDGVNLENGDSVGVCEVWKPPSTFDGVKTKDLLAVQHALKGVNARYSEQAGDDWAGVIVADILSLDATADRKRIKKMIEVWIKNKALVKIPVKDARRKDVPCLDVGEWATE
jgi:hypothetical protein